ncbi:DUF4870 domain-containing protein [Patescibacteria group bacterium]
MTEEKKSSSKDKDVEENKTMAVLSYIWILCLVPLLAKRDSKFAQFHAKQGLIIFGMEIITHFLFWFQPFQAFFALALLIVSVIGVIKSYNGEWYKVPLIYDLSKKINL